MTPGALLAEARSAHQRGDLDAALQVLVTRTGLLDEAGVPLDDPERGLGWELEVELLRVAGRLDEATALGGRAVELARAAGWARLPATVAALGACELSRGRLARAASLLHEALDGLSQEPDPVVEAGALRWLSIVERRRGNDTRAHAHLQRAIALARAHDLLRIEASCRASLGNLLAGAGRMRAARSEYEAAVRIYEGLDNELFAAESKVALAYVAGVLGDRETGGRLLAEALLTFRRVDSRKSMFHALTALGDQARHAGDLGAARRHYAEAEALCAALGPLETLYAVLNRVATRIAAGDYEASAGQLVEPIEEARRLATSSLEIVGHALMRVCLSASGDWEAWEAEQEVLRRLLRREARVEPDLAWAARTAAELLEARGRTPENLDRMARMRSEAFFQFRQLGGEADAAREAWSLKILYEYGAPIPLGPFALYGRLGAGAMGTVWRGVHRSTGTPVAVKVLTSRLARTPSAHEAFSREVRSVASLDHPNIVKVLDRGTLPAWAEAMGGEELPEGSPYLVMELVSSGSLEPLCGNLSWRHAREVLRSLLVALAHSHARDIVHLDIKPGNALVCWGPDGDPSVKLTDFGLARVFGEAVDGRLAGTPAYMAPEQVSGQWRLYGPWTDLYAVGCVAHALLAGSPPFGIDNVFEVLDARVNAEPPPLQPVVPVPEGAADWVAGLTRRRPIERFSSAVDAIEALDALGDASDAEPRAPGGEVQDSTEASWFVVDLARRPPDRGDLYEGRGRAPAEPRRVGDWRGPEAGGVILPQVSLGLFGLRTWPLVGRAAVQDALWSQVRQVHATAGGPRRVTLMAGAGEGLSRILAWASQRSSELGLMLPVAVRYGPGEPEGAAEVRCLAGFLRTEGLAGGKLAVQVARRLRLLGVERPSEVLVGDIRRVLEGTSILGTAPGILARMVARLSEARPAILTLDDAHLCGLGGTLLRALAGYEPPVRCLVLLGLREDSLEPGADSELARLEDLIPGERLLLGPLDAAATRDLLGHLLTLDPGLAEEVAGKTNGNPHFALELVGAWIANDDLVPGPEGWTLRPGTRRQIPEGVRQM